MDAILPTERLTRYLLDKTYTRADGTVRHSAFMPPSNLMLSVYRSSELQEERIWELGIQKVAVLRDKPLIGRADILASNVSNADRELKLAPDPPPSSPWAGRSLNFKKFPAADDTRRHLYMALCQAAKRLNLLPR